MEIAWGIFWGTVSFGACVCGLGMWLQCTGWKSSHELAKERLQGELAESKRQAVDLNQRIEARDKLLDVQAARFNNENCELKQRLAAALDFGARNALLLEKVHRMTCPAAIHSIERTDPGEDDEQRNSE